MMKEKIYKPTIAGNDSMHPGDHKRSPDESYSEKLKETLVFIDEAFLSKLSKHLGQGDYIKFDKINFAEEIAKNEELHCKKIFYYLAPPFQSESPTTEETKKKEGHDKFVKKLREKDVIVREGRCQRLKIDGKFHYSQKGVDILMAMDMMSTPQNYPNITKIIIIASDSDFVPVIKYLEEQRIKTIFYTYYEKIRDSEFSRNNHLIKSASKYVIITKKSLEESLLKKEGGMK